MKHKVRLSNLLTLFVLVSLASCQTAATPYSTIIPDTSATSQLTVTLTTTPQPTMTTSPTITPMPFCGTVVPPHIAVPPTDASKKFVKFEPPDNQVYFGFTFRLWDEIPQNAMWGDVRPFEERICDSVKNELSGKIPTFMVVDNWWDTFSSSLDDIIKIQATLGSSVTPLLKWSVGVSHTIKNIPSGQDDKYIKQYALEVKQYGKPIFITLFCRGFNGNWDQGCSPKANPDLTRADFINSWQRVIDIFRQEEVTNVAWIWEPFVPPATEDWGLDDWRAYYPGDDYVDWIGALQPGSGVPSWLNPLNQFSKDHQKPLLVEFAIRQENNNRTHQQWVNWLTTMFDYVKSHPQIKAISYINIKSHPDPITNSSDRIFLYDRKVYYVANVNDGDQRLIAGGDDIRALFADRIADSRYISTLVVAP